MTLKTHAYLKASIKKNPSRLFNLPVDKRSVALIATALRADASILGEIPPNEINSNVAMAVATALPRQIHFIPRRYRTEEVCLKAIENSDLLRHVPQESLSDQFLEEFLFKHPSKIADVPDSHINEALVDYVLSLDVNVAHYLPNRFITTERVYGMLKGNGGLIRLIDESLWTDGMIDRALATTPSLLISLPKVWHSEDRILQALRQVRGTGDVYNILKATPQELRSFPVLFSACLRNTQILQLLSATQRASFIATACCNQDDHPFPKNVSEALRGMRGKDDDLRFMCGSYLAAMHGIDDVVKHKISPDLAVHLAEHFEKAAVVRALNDNIQAKRALIDDGLGI